MYPPEEVEAIGRWAVEHGIWVVTDEIYEHLDVRRHEFTSMPALVPELADQCVILNGVAKTYAMTGWRVGWMIGPTDVIDGGDQLPVALHLERANVAQRAALAAVSGDLDGGGEMRDAFERRGRTMHQMLNDDPRRHLPRAAGRVLLLPVLRGRARPRARRAHGRDTTLELAELLLDEAKVAIVPGEAFGAPGYARLSFALGDDDLGEGVRASRPSSGARSPDGPHPRRPRSSPTAGSTALRAAGHEVDVAARTSTPEQLLDAVSGRRTR